MSAVERISERLRRHPELTYRMTGRTITVEPLSSDGFAVSLAEEAQGFVVGFDGWHEHFATEEEALDCFAFGLSDRCRLRVNFRGSFPYRWTVEERVGEEWSEDSTTGLLFYPFWRRSRVEWRRNTVLSDA